MVMSDVKTNVRLPDDLYDKIKVLAERDYRSINAEMVVLLQESVARRERDDRQREKEDRR